MAPSVSGSEVSSDGPVLNLVNKKLRGLKKKYNRILQTEENQTLGKPLNKEQEDVLKSKPVVAALIDEYEKLRLPLASAVQEELSRLSPPPSIEEEDDEKEKQSGSGSDSDLGDLLGLLYFGCLFYVKPQSEYTNTMLTRTLERECCLTYDYVTDDATDLLGERDLDLISTLGGLLTSRPVYAGVSHKKALEECIQHAKRWLHKSDELVPLGSHPGPNVTYAGLREKLNKIMALDYFTTTPEMKAPVDVAAAVGKYNNVQIQVAEGGMVQTQDGLQIDDALAQYQQKDDLGEIQAEEVSIDQSSPLDENPKEEPSTQIPTENNITDQQDEERAEAESEHNEDHSRDSEHKGQHQYNSRRPYQNQRGGRGGGRRGFSNGRGGRGARGGGDSRGYQNGRSQQYYDSGYYPRNYYNSRGQGGGRSGGPAAYSNNNHGPAAAAAHGGHVAVGVNP